MKTYFYLTLFLFTAANGFAQTQSSAPSSSTHHNSTFDTSNPPSNAVQRWHGSGNTVQSLAPGIWFNEFPYNHNEHITCDGSYYYTINGGNATFGQVNKFTLTGTLVQTYPILIDGRGLSFNAADSFLYASTYLGDIVKITNLATASFTTVYPGIMQDPQASFAISPDGTKFYDFYSGTLKVHLFSNGSVINTYYGLAFGAGNYGGDAAVAVDSNYYYTWNAYTDSVYVYNQTGGWVQTMKLDSGDNGMSLSYTNCNLFVSRDGNYSIGTWYGYPLSFSCGAAALPRAVFTSSDTVFCDELGQCISFFDHSTGNPTSWQWSFPGATPSSSNLQNPDSICYYTPGTYPVTLIVSNGTAYDTLAVNSMIIFGSAPAPPTISVLGNVLTSSYGASYQWYFNGVIIPGATDSFYVATQTGTYSVRITDATGGCSSLSGGQYINITFLDNLLADLSGIKIYPNPVSNRMTIAFNSPLKNDAELIISDVTGRELEKVLIEKFKTSYSLSLQQYSAGVYILSVRTSSQNPNEAVTVNKKFTVLH